MRLSALQVVALMRRTASTVAPKYGLNAEALAQYATAVAWIESRFDPRAHAPRPHTAKGLMQINNITKVDAEKWAGVAPASMERMLDADYSALLGMTVLARRIRTCTTVDAGIAAYNQGNCSARSIGRARGYVAKWKKAMADLRPAFQTPTPGLIASASPEFY